MEQGAAGYSARQQGEAAAPQLAALNEITPEAEQLILRLKDDWCIRCAVRRDHAQIGDGYCAWELR